MKYKFKIIDIFLLIMIFVIIDDFKGGYIFAAIFETLITFDTIRLRIKEIKRSRNLF